MRIAASSCCAASSLVRRRRRLRWGDFLVPALKRGLMQHVSGLWHLDIDDAAIEALLSENDKVHRLSMLTMVGGFLTVLRKTGRLRRLFVGFTILRGVEETSRAFPWRRCSITTAPATASVQRFTSARPSDCARSPMPPWLRRSSRLPPRSSRMPSSRAATLAGCALVGAGQGRPCPDGTPAPIPEVTQSALAIP